MRQYHQNEDTREGSTPSIREEMLPHDNSGEERHTWQLNGYKAKRPSTRISSTIKKVVSKVENLFLHSRLKDFKHFLILRRQVVKLEFQGATGLEKN